MRAIFVGAHGIDHGDQIPGDAVFDEQAILEQDKEGE